MDSDGLSFQGNFDWNISIIHSRIIAEYSSEVSVLNRRRRKQHRLWWLNGSPLLDEFIVPTPCELSLIGFVTRFLVIGSVYHQFLPHLLDEARPVADARQTPS